MKRPRPRGMRDIRTAQNLLNRSKPSGRAQAVTQLARLEHERMRLEREMKLWAQKYTQTKNRLHGVLKQLSDLESLSDELAAREGLTPTNKQLRKLAQSGLPSRKRASHDPSPADFTFEY
ncbi:MAG: hypothetical protein AAF970_03800 [Bacteroidota bacterium]